jgi:hypothetical protein
MTDISLPEQHVCENLSPLLREHAVGDSLHDPDSYSDVLRSLEYFLSTLLREVHDEWQHESLDGIYPWWFRKTGDREAALLGLAILISDQTLTPLYVQLQLSPTWDRVAWIDLRLGERTKTGCRRVPYGDASVPRLVSHVSERYESLDWFYQVGYGERES